jgi:tyrosyl-tRNA synthetase
MTPEATADPRVVEQLDAFRRNAVDLIEEKELAERLASRLASGEPLRIKFGMDPSSPDLHVGHAIPLLKLRALQELGHTIVLIVGDSTAMVGDPSGRNKLRPQLTREAVEENLTTYTDQAAAILDMERTEVRRNSEWFDRMGFEEVLRLCGRSTVAQMLERDTFQQRIQANEPIGIHEFLYPLMQGWDSVEVRADVEVGGSDQLFNLHVGRRLQEQVGQPPQVLLTFPLINGSDGRKMSKSYGNAIGLTDEPADAFGKVMALPDDVVETWFRLLTPLADAEVAEVVAGHPREAKARLAREIVGFFHGADAAASASDAFDRQFRDRELPDDIPEHVFADEWSAEGVPLFVLLRGVGLASSGSEARRLVVQGGVKLDGEPVLDPGSLVARPHERLLISVGKRRHAWVRPGQPSG